MCNRSQSIGTFRNRCGLPPARKSSRTSAENGDMSYRLVFVLSVLASALAGPSSAQLARLKPPDVKFVPTPQKTVLAMLALARVTSADVVYDLGSGDGRIPI